MTFRRRGADRLPEKFDMQGRVRVPVPNMSFRTTRHGLLWKGLHRHCLAVACRVLPLDCNEDVDYC